jgi:hypothetical protein
MASQDAPRTALPVSLLALLALLARLALPGAASAG